MVKPSDPIPDDAPSEGSPGVAAVNRALTLLAAFSQHRAEMTLAELSQMTGLYKSTILRLAESLEHFGYLQRTVLGRYKVGPAPLKLAALYQSNLHPAELVMPVLRELSRTTSESAAFYLLAGDRRLCAYRARSPRAITDNVQQGELLSLDRGAGGHVLLAFEGREGATYDAIRANKLAVTLGERDKETAAVACPVFGPRQQLEGALSISGPLSRFTPAAVSDMSKSLVDAARALTAAMGGDADLLVDARLPNQKR